MIIVEVLANKIADRMAGQLSLDHDRRSVIAYGMIGMLQVTTLFVIVTIIGVITNTVYESLIILFCVGFIRKSTGGAHAETMNGCNTISVLSITLLALSSRYLLSASVENYVNYGITIAVFGIAYFIFYLRVPVDSPNKPIVSPQKIKRLRRESFIKLFLFFLLTIGAIALVDRNLRFFSIASSLRVAIIWQLITLTKIGISLLARLDSIINRMMEKLKIK